MNCEEYYERECFLSQYLEYDKKTKEWIPIDKEAVGKFFIRQEQQKRNIDKLKQKAYALDRFSEDILNQVLKTDFKEYEKSWHKSVFIAHKIHNKVERERFSYMKKLKERV